MAKTKTTTVEDLVHKMRAQLVQLFESACEIDYPKGSDAAFRDALQARLKAGVADLAAASANDEEGIIRASQDVRLYRASARIKNPDASALAFRVEIQKTLGIFFRLQDAVKGAANK